jgi:hypothetical protein
VAGSSGVRGGSLGKVIGSSPGKAMGSFLGKENSVLIVEVDKDGSSFDRGFGGILVLRGFSGLRF